MLLWARKLKKKGGIEENYITAFNTLNLGFNCQHKKICFKIDFQKLNLRLVTVLFSGLVKL